jgi:5-methylcytosine-specific restriction protein A
MPTRPPRRCTTPGCPRSPVPPSGKCKPCQGAARRPRPSPATQGYGHQHRERFVKPVLKRDPVCVLCRAAPSTRADHWPVDRRDLELTGADPNDPSHGRGLCASCDSKQTAARQPGGWHQPGDRY